MCNAAELHKKKLKALTLRTVADKALEDIERQSAALPRAGKKLGPRVEKFEAKKNALLEKLLIKKLRSNEKKSSGIRN